MNVPTLITASQIEDIRLAAAKMTGATRRSYQAEMAEKHCNGNPGTGLQPFIPLLSGKLSI